jgi:DNA-binding transcriptional LysR family regulator
MASISIVDGIDISSLRMFLAAVEFGSVSQAARRMNVTQPSATAKLKKLESQLGATLLERSRVGSRPTEVGARLAPACADVIAAVEALIDRAEALRTERDRLSVAATRHVADHFLPRWISELALDHVHLDLVETSTRDVARAVRSDSAVIGFTEGPKAPIGLGSAIVATEEIVGVVGRGHEWFMRTAPIRRDELAATTVILPTPGSGTRDVVEAAIAGTRRTERTLSDVVEVSSSSAARLSALAGVGVGFLPRCWISGLDAAGSLRTLEFAEMKIAQPVRMVWRGTRPSDPVARDLVDRLAALTGS